MYTVLLVDDELPVLETLQNRIPWQQFGIDSLLTATNGLQAWELINSRHVDLLITDIRMPQMDGLELLRNVRSLYPDIHCILLTAYGEFEYARAAIQLGVENYLLKPLPKEEMEETIEKALDNIYTNRKNSDRLFYNNILMRWAKGSISTEELSERSSLLGINIYLPYYCAVCIKKIQDDFSLSSFHSACKEALKQDYEVYHFRDDKGREVFLIGGLTLSQDTLADRFATVTSDQNTASGIRLAIGHIVQDSDALSQSYQSACELMDTSITSGQIQLIASENQSLLQKNLLMKDLLSLFHQDSEPLRIESFRSLAQRIISHPETDYSSLLADLKNSLLLLFSQEFPNQTGIQEQLYSRSYLCTTALSNEDLVSAIADLLEYSNLLYNYYFKQFSPVVQHAIDYIQKNYSESLSLKELCAKNKMSTNYLGYLFKKETGMFFNNYLTQYRICCSFQLLMDTNKKISEIASQVGFSSTSYYINCFKKQTGLSPIKYRSLQFDMDEKSFAD